MPPDIRSLTFGIRYFKGQKLDYPNQDTPKASRKYVKAMKRLQVSHDGSRFDCNLV